MNPAKRIIVNTSVQYAKAIITMALTLYSTRLVLDALSVSDYGIYMVIAGVVAMLGFITNALAITTQRYLSYNQAQGDIAHLKKIFVNSLFIHLVFGLIVVAALLALQGILFDRVLNIDPLRIPTAQKIYVISAFMLLVTVLSSPYKALLIAHENIVYIAVVETVDAIVKLGMAISLAYITFDKLLAYQWMIATIVTLNLLAFSAYSLFKFPESAVVIRFRDLDSSYIKKITAFAGWTTYGMGCVAGRVQGTALVLNHFWGTAINAAYGISNQIFAAISFLVGSILNAMNPQLMQAEGHGDRQKMLEMAVKQSKFTTAILALVVIPLVAEMPAILDLWLKEVPEHTVMFCRMILLAFLADQITVGLGSACQAIGQIRTFTLLTFTPKLLYMPVIWLMFRYGSSVYDAMVLYVLLEVAVALVRIPYMHYKAGLNVGAYCRRAIVPVVLQSAVIAAVCWLCVKGLHFHFRFFITAACGVAAGLLSTWQFVLNDEERAFSKEALRKLTKR